MLPFWYFLCIMAFRNILFFQSKGKEAVFMIEREKLISMVQDLKDGKDDAASVIYETFHKPIYYQIYKTVNNDAELAADLTQDTFLYVLEKINDLNENVAFVTWIERIAASKCKDYSIKRKELLVDEYEDGYSIFDQEEELREEFIPGEALDKEDLKRIILNIINNLPQDQREAILLRYFNEVPVKEIAQIQAVSEGTVKSRLNYGRKAIKQAVEEYEKKNDIRLHCAGVIPLLLWFFRAYRVSNGISLTAPTASATFSAATVAAEATAATTSTSVAAASTAATKTGVGVGVKTAGKAVAAKVIAAVTAATVAVGGIAVGIGSREKQDISLDGYWTGYLYEYTKETADMPIYTDDGLVDIELLEKIEDTIVENSEHKVDLEITDTNTDTCQGNIRVQFPNGEIFESSFVGHWNHDTQYWYNLSFELEKGFSLHFPELPEKFLFANYDSQSDQLCITKDGYIIEEEGIFSYYRAELFRTDPHSDLETVETESFKTSEPAETAATESTMSTENTGVTEAATLPTETRNPSNNHFPDPPLERPEIPADKTPIIETAPSLPEPPETEPPATELPEIIPAPPATEPPAPELPVPEPPATEPAREDEFILEINPGEPNDGDYNSGDDSFGGSSGEDD